VTRANASAEAPVLPGMIEVVMRIAAAGVMTDPAIIFGMDVRRFGMPRLIIETATFVGIRRS
jgi:hypothetical protein